MAIEPDYSGNILMMPRRTRRTNCSMVIFIVVIGVVLSDILQQSLAYQDG
jgi:hypothetical protein